jgi:glucuronate isomerase
LPFIHEDFLLQTNAARKLYHGYAEQEPILDYHSHLSPKDIAEGRQFRNLFEIWLEGDHYKWRAMRANGIAEKYCTGDATPQEKFNAWAKTVPYTLRNPLYHWTHLELQRYFGISDLLDESSASHIWDEANSLLATKDFSARAIVKKFNIQVVCTTDDPCDGLAHHRATTESEDSFRMYPTFRPDRALLVRNPEVWNAWVEQLSQASNTSIVKFQDFLDALKRRHDYFHQLGGRLSDHGLNYCHASFCSEATAAAIFDGARAGRAATPQEHEQFASFMMLYFGVLDSEKGWTKQLHIGALRNANSGRLQKIGPDTGFDSIGDWNQSAAFCAYLDRLEQENALPKIIVYNLNPADNYALATTIGNFQDERIPGKIQFGSGWWFLDQKEAIEWQLNALSNCGLLSRFIGMLTDSRSFMSFPRHEYFRRVLCNLLGNDMEKGELPNDEKLIGSMVRNICFANAKNYLGLELSHSPASREAHFAQK